MADTYANADMTSTQVTSLMRRINALEAGLSGYAEGDYLTEFCPVTGAPPSSGEVRGQAGRFAYGGNIWVVDNTTGGDVLKFTTNGTYVSQFDTPENNVQLGIVVNATRIFVTAANPTNTLVKVYTYQHDGTFDTEFSISGVTGITGGDFQMNTDASGNLVIVDGANDTVVKHSITGTHLLSFGTAGAGAGQFLTPNSVCCDASDNFYVTDSGRDKLIKFNSSGVYVSEVGTSGAGAGQFQAPNGVCFDGTDIYVQDTSRGVILMFDTSLSYLGEFTNASHTPFSRWIAADSSGFIYPGSSAFACVKFAGRNTVAGGAQTEFFSYTTTAATSLGTPDGGVAVPALAALTPANNNADLIPRHIVDMRDAIETLAPYFTNAVTSNPFNWTASSADNLYFVAMGDRTEYGATGGAAYDWTRTEAQMETTFCYSIDIGEINSCITLLEAS